MLKFNSNDLERLKSAREQDAAGQIDTWMSSLYEDWAEQDVMIRSMRISSIRRAFFALSVSDEANIAMLVAIDHDTKVDLVNFAKKTENEAVLSDSLTPAHSKVAWIFQQVTSE